MRLPRILVVDDQYARDLTEWRFFRQLTCVLEVGQSGTDEQPVAEAVLCSGQSRHEDRVENDYEVIRKTIRDGECTWALVLLDVQFDSGLFRQGQIPAGQQGDTIFGEQVRARLAVDLPEVPVVMLSSKRQQELSDRGTPYLSKQGLDERALKTALLRYGRLTNEQTRYILGLGRDVVAESPPTLAAFREAYIHGAGTVSVLILGENGVGKEVLARYVHEQSGRKGQFVPVNIAALPKDLVESELFGVEKRVATSVNERMGLFELAADGTLFLDEIGDMPVDAQAKVLRALQEREIYRVGGRKPIKLDIRLVCATSRDLHRMVQEKTFREDLYYRINSVPITLPPLRERPEEIGAMAQSFLERFQSDGGKTGITFAPEAITTLTNHPFPGNVRELENLIRRLTSAGGNHQVISLAEVQSVLKAPAPIQTQRLPETAEAALTEQSMLSLIDLPRLLRQIVVDKDDPELAGAKPRLEAALRELLQRVAGATLERCRHPVTGSLNRQQAMQLLTGEETLKGKDPARIINEVLGRKVETQVTEEDLARLVEIWRQERPREF